MKKQLRKAMICTVAMMLAAIVSLTGVTYAWFSSSDTSQVSNISIGLVQVDGSIHISNQANPSSWGRSLRLGIEKTNFEPASTAPSTLANGKLNFFSGRMGSFDTSLLCTEPINAAMGADKYYVEQDLYIMNDTTSAMNITLDQDFTSAGLSTASYAMRLAIVDHGEYKITGTGLTEHTADTVKASDTNKVHIYEFNATDHLAGGIDSGVKNTCGVKKATVIDNTKLPQNADGPIYEEPERYTQKDIEASGGELDASWVGRVKDESIFFDTKTHESAALSGTDDFLEKIVPCYKGGKNLVISVGAAKMNAETGELVPYYHKITVYLWLEGQDVDCITTISGQTLPITIGFTQAD